MPRFRPLAAEEVAAMRTYRRGTVDLTMYTQFLRGLAIGEGGEVTLDPGDLKRTVKRRLTRAAHLLGRDLRYRRTEADIVRFEVRARA